MLLALSLIVLACGPLLARAAKSRPEFLSALDAFIVVSIGGLVFLEILPEALREAGFVALAAAVVGLVGPGLAERYLRSAARRAHTVTLVLALLGLAVHACIDGAALSRPGGEATTLALAVVLHRLPVALALWALVAPAYGARVGAAVLSLMGVTTVLGYLLGDVVFSAVSGTIVPAFEALVAGSLIHVIFHAPDAGSGGALGERSRRVWNSLGSVAGITVVVALLLTHGSSHGGHASHAGHVHIGIFSAFLSLALAIAPALYVAYFIAALVRAFEPRVISDVRPTGRFGEALQGVILSVRAPVCTECNLPLVQNCIRAGIPTAAVLAILIATPGLSLDALLVAVPLLGAEFALLKLTGTVIVALFVGGLLGWALVSLGRGKVGLPYDDSVADGMTELGGVFGADGGSADGDDALVMARRQFVQVVDRTAPWILFGTGVAAVALELINPAWFGTLGAMQIPLFAALGMLVNLGPAGAMPLLVVLLVKGASVGAVMAFGLTSPVAGIATIAFLGERYGLRGASGFLAIVIVIAIGVGFSAEALLPDILVADLPGESTATTSPAAGSPAAGSPAAGSSATVPSDSSPPADGPTLDAAAAAAAAGRAPIAAGDDGEHAHDHGDGDDHDHDHANDSGHDHADDSGDDHGHDHADDSGDDHGHDHANDHGHDHAADGVDLAVVWSRSGWINRICLVIVAALTLASFLRRGARRFFGQVFVTEEGDDHDHHHHHHP